MILLKRNIECSLNDKVFFLIFLPRNIFARLDNIFLNIYLYWNFSHFVYKHRQNLFFCTFLSMIVEEEITIYSPCDGSTDHFFFHFKTSFFSLFWIKWQSKTNKQKILIIFIYSFLWILHVPRTLIQNETKY